MNLFFVFSLHFNKYNVMMVKEVTFVIGSFYFLNVMTRILDLMLDILIQPKPKILDKLVVFFITAVNISYHYIFLDFLVFLYSLVYHTALLLCVSAVLGMLFTGDGTYFMPSGFVMHKITLTDLVDLLLLSFIICQILCESSMLGQIRDSLFNLYFKKGLKQLALSVVSKVSGYLKTSHFLRNITLYVFFVIVSPEIEDTPAHIINGDIMNFLKVFGDIVEVCLVGEAEIDFVAPDDLHYAIFINCLQQQSLLVSSKLGIISYFLVMVLLFTSFLDPITLYIFITTFNAGGIYMLYYTAFNVFLLTHYHNLLTAAMQSQDFAAFLFLAGTHEARCCFLMIQLTSFYATLCSMIDLLQANLFRHCGVHFLTYGRSVDSDQNPLLDTLWKMIKHAFYLSSCLCLGPIIIRLDLIRMTEN
ncbi:hypothetical protein ACJX0J_038951 [Zea mays]